MSDLPHDCQTEPIVAWRMWKVRNGLLQSFVYSDFWPPLKAMKATCRRSRLLVTSSTNPEPPPREHCQCGVYAVKTRELALKQRQEATWTHCGAPQLAVGRVSLWGKVLETPLGYRSQFAYPLDLQVLGGSSWELCRRYAVDEFRLLPASDVPSVDLDRLG